MLGTEQQPQLDPGRRAQQVDVAPALPVHPRLVGEQRDALAGHEVDRVGEQHLDPRQADRKSTRLNSSHLVISYAVFCLKKKKKKEQNKRRRSSKNEARRDTERIY